VTVTTTDAQEKTTIIEFPAIYDGKTYPVKGPGQIDAQALVKINNFQSRATAETRRQCNRLGRGYNFGGRQNTDDQVQTTRRRAPGRQLELALYHSLGKRERERALTGN